ncbi:hypothetical protein FOA52_006028 [Chlamydomonas sp. UWO 241]|nr:hypothetical protein FOA52_006028 [Chlamydomonas sp. UWO 241]
MHAETYSRRHGLVSGWARTVEALVAAGLLFALYLVANAWGAAEGNGLLSGVVALAGALLWWLALGSRLIAAVVAPLAAAASGELDDGWGSDGDLALDPRLAGVWLKDTVCSDSMDGACDAMHLHGIIRSAVRLVRGIELRPGAPTSTVGAGGGGDAINPNHGRPVLDLAVFSVLPWFKVRERYEVGGEPSFHARRDLRRGRARCSASLLPPLPASLAPQPAQRQQGQQQHGGDKVASGGNGGNGGSASQPPSASLASVSDAMTAAVEACKPGAIGRLQVHLSWSEPFSGHGADEFLLAGPDELHVRSKLYVHGGQSAGYTTVYRRKGARGK